MTMAIYRAAPELANTCREIIREHHQHLADANIAYMFRSGKWLINGATRFGQAIVAPPVWRTITNYDLVLVVNEKAYMAQTDKRKIATLDNLLCYFNQPTAGPAGASYTNRAPDIQEFSDVVHRHKVYFTNLPAIDSPGQLQKIEFEHADDNEPEEIGEIELEDPESDCIEIQDYDDIDDTGCIVTPLISFEK